MQAEAVIKVLKAGPGLDPDNAIQKTLGARYQVIEHDPDRALEDQVGEATVLLLRDRAITASVIDAAPRLKLLQRYGQHVVGVDFEHAARRGIPVANIPTEITRADRIGRHVVWSIACCGFAICYGALIALESAPTHPLLYLMVISQGFLGYAVTSVMGPIVKETFDGPHYGTIFGALTLALSGGGAAGPWVAGLIHDANGSYRLAFAITFVCCLVSAAVIWLARVESRSARQ